MKEYPSADPKMGPTEKKKEADLHFDHHMLNGSKELAPGDRVKLIVHGHVHANNDEDDLGPGHTHVKIHAIEQHPEQDSQEKKGKHPNLSEMKMDDLKQHLQDLEEKHKNMEGHSESGIKEKGDDEE